MLELAAKAAGHVWRRNPYIGHFEIEGLCPPDGGDGWITWNPLDDDGDAFRLAVDLGLVVHGKWSRNQVNIEVHSFCGEYKAVVRILSDDACAEVRQAIVKVAAEIGRRM